VRPQGYAIVVEPYAPVKEFDTITCSHCQVIVFLRPTPDGKQQDQGGFCRQCMKPVCGPCADHGACKPFEKKLEEYERAAVRGRYLDKLFGSGG
jgi:hypothetical protein